MRRIGMIVGLVVLGLVVRKYMQTHHIELGSSVSPMDKARGVQDTLDKSTEAATKKLEATQDP